MKLEGMSIKQLREFKDKIDRAMPDAVSRARADILAPEHAGDTWTWMPHDFYSTFLPTMKVGVFFISTG